MLHVFRRITITILSLLQVVLYIIRRIYERFRYNDVTIAEKFRKQGAKVGKNCFIQIRKLGTEPYLVTIGDNVSIAHGVDLMTHDGASVIFRDELPSLRYFGRIVIEDNCFIGSDAIITAGVTIGKNSIIGPRAIVINDVKPGSIMMGNPAFRVSTAEKYKQKCLQEWERQGLAKFESLFKGKDKFEVQQIMRSKAFRMQLQKHLESVDLLKPAHSEVTSVTK
jgi:acetyltransferase-like isoleucine patch superfamily enzyme